MVLTDEQRERMERNRKRALEMVTLRQQTQTRAPAVTNRCNLPVSVIPSTSNQRFVAPSNVIGLNINLSSSVVVPQRSVYGQSNVQSTSQGNIQSSANNKISSNSTFSKSQFQSTASNPQPPSRISPYFAQQKTVQGKLAQKIKVNCQLISRERFEVEISPFRDKFLEVCRSLTSRIYDGVKKSNTFLLKDYNGFVTKLKETFKEDALEFEELPRVVKTFFAKAINGQDHNVPCPISMNSLESQIESHLFQHLFPFQRQGIQFVIGKAGRALLADDMGLGKTVQALGVASYYRREWPCLVVCPSSVRFVWKQAISRWLPSVSDDKVYILLKTTDPLPERSRSDFVVITSYDMMTRKQTELAERRFGIVILDESHMIKERDAKRTKGAKNVTCMSKRLILLTGTPALSRPAELFTQIGLVNKSVFPRFREFAVRYCDGKEGQFGFESLGATNTTELKYVLEETLMIRRLKSVVLHELPSKRREMIILDKSAVKTSLKNLVKAKDRLETTQLKGSEMRSAILEYFHETALAKEAAVKSYVLDLLERGCKFVVFAHHHSMIDAISLALTTKGVDFIRIDGATNSRRRQECCDDFQTRDEYKVALLSITAASTGITLTAASLVVFAELFWNPGILVQAEDRTHRVGQEDSVLVQYLVASGTADDHIWNRVKDKLDVLNSVGLSKDNFGDAATTTIRDKPGENEANNSLLNYFAAIENDKPSDDWEEQGPSSKKQRL